MSSGLRRRIVVAVGGLMLVLLPLLSASRSTTSKSTPSSSAPPAAVFDRAQAPRPPNAFLGSSSGEVRGDQDSYSWVGRDADVFGLRDPKQELRLAHDLSLRDLTDPAEGQHAIQLLVDIATQSLAKAWECEVRVVRGPRIVTRGENYDRLGYEADAVTRDARYTRYVDDQRLLRSHTSALVPSALDALGSDPPEDVLIACPGITYRRDAIDRLHTGTPHQLDLWRVSRRPLGSEELDEMIRILADALLPGRAWRWRPRVHPYTLAGRQVDGLGDDGWVEVWECGLAHPAVLATAGLGAHTGLALGMGLERLLMVRKGIPDIRLVRSNDPRVADQMLDLEPYRPVSHLPGVRRDLSVAVAKGDDVETIGDRVRAALGAEADLLESVSVLSETPYEKLPPRARSRLGMHGDQKNVLVRLDMRPVERTLTDGEANELRNRVYAAIHQGADGQWATS